MTKSVFINELGNEITIQVNRLEGDNVFIAMYGPNSSVTNMVTLQEARVLRDILSEEL